MTKLCSLYENACLCSNYFHEKLYNMRNFNEVFTLLAKEKNIGLNLDLLGSGVINIIILLVILIYIGHDFLESSLRQRQKKIIQNVQDAEKRSNAATDRLKEAQKQLAQAQMIISEIKYETLKTKRNLLNADSEKTNAELAVKFNKALVSLSYREQQIFAEINEQIISSVLINAVSKIKINLEPAEQAKLIDANIAKLEGQL